MRIINFIILFQIITSFYASSQAYNPIQFGDARWHYREYNFGPTTKSYSYFSKDTVGYYYLGKRYWRIDRLFASTYSPSPDHFYIYDDTLNRKVFTILDTNVNDVKLLYDFSVNAGDTIFNLYSLVNDTVKVDSVKYTLDQFNINRKHIFVHSINLPMVQEWVEGIGGMYDFLIPSFTFTDPTYAFICNEVINQFNYGDSIQCSNFITSINDIIVEAENIEVGYNPINETLIITNQNSIKYKIDLIDIDGRKLVSRNLFNTVETISLSNFRNSIIIYQIIGSNEQKIIGKIMIQ